MHFISWIVLGLLAGALAKLIMPGDDPGGIIVTTLIGIVGAIVGGLVGQALGFHPNQGFFSWATWIWAIIGSLILLALYRVIAGRRSVWR
ncbi:MAG TPA: GlsB/YeaQ/YmgE family stress response membrane protein [Pseudonocardiaceae bacterium]|nr:GlsB/YeaQ/YmgE family stress response membrane protein [Pseudonocardiaceae bacterium]